MNTLFWIWSAGMAVRLLDFAVPMSRPVGAALSLGAMVLAGATVWRSTAEISPWTPHDIRDGAIGWGIVAALFTATIALVVTPGAARVPAGIGTALLVAGLSAFVYRRADRLGVDPPAQEPASALEPAAS
jgi:hypothetical protein